MDRAIRRAVWLGGVAWFLSWFELYLEVYRYHHESLRHVFGLASSTPFVGAGARPGAWLRADLAGAALAPLVFLSLVAYRWAARALTQPAAWTRTEPSFPVAAAATMFGLILSTLGAINQLIRRPPLAVDLTLRTGNGGFIVVGAVLVVAGVALRLPQGRRSSLARQSR